MKMSKISLLQAYLPLKMLSQTNIHVNGNYFRKIQVIIAAGLLTLKIDFKGQILGLFTHLSTCMKRDNFILI